MGNSRWHLVPQQRSKSPRGAGGGLQGKRNPWVLKDVAGDPSGDG